jgi:hypothetical protein
MSKEKRLGAEAKRNTKPFLDIKVYEPIKKNLTIMRESENTLKLYTRFKNETSGLKSVTEDSVVDALIGTLNNDAQFIEWKLESDCKNQNEENALSANV